MPKTPQEITAEANNTLFEKITLSSYKQNGDEVKAVIAQGADVNVRNSDGNTPLHQAVFAGSLETVKILLERGAKVNAKNGNGETARTFAEHRKNQQPRSFDIPTMTEVGLGLIADELGNNGGARDSANEEAYMNTLEDAREAAITAMFSDGLSRAEDYRSRRNASRYSGEERSL